MKDKLLLLQFGRVWPRMAKYKTIVKIENISVKNIQIEDLRATGMFYLKRGHRKSDGHTGFLKNYKVPFFSR